MNSAVARNFRVAVWVTVLGGLALFARGASDFDAVSEVYRGYAAQAIAGPLVLAMITTLFWFLWYREGSGHWPAFGVGAMLLVAAGGLFAGSAASGLGYDGTELAFLVYAGVSHVLYGLLEWRDVAGMLGGEGD